MDAPAVRRRTALVALAAATAVLLPGVAQAHELGAVAGRSVLDFVPLGITHMLLGWDHLLFIAGVLVIARDWRQSAKYITAFVLGHSLTLVMATVLGWRLDATLVDVVIGLSVVYVGVIALRGGSPSGRVFASTIFGFGLVHGLGLSTRLQAFDLPQAGRMARVAAFNVGIELGQLIAIAAIVGLARVAKLLWASRDQHQPQSVQLISCALVIGGLVAAALVVLPSLRGDAEDTAASSSGPTIAAGTAQGDVPCVEGPRRELLDSVEAPIEQPFIEPGADLPAEALGYWVAAGYVVYLYREDLPEDKLNMVRSAVFNAFNGGIYAAPVAGQVEDVKAVTARTTLTCQEIDEIVLDRFSTEWFDALAADAGFSRPSP